ncbi:MAG: rod-binding protein [Holophaga sp.]|nr:rod-binding protein [Holophaga sp.]
MSDLKIQAPSDLVSPDLPKLNAKTSLKESSQQFEGLLMAQLFQSLRKTVEPSGLFGDEGQARQTYEYLFDQAIVNHAMAAGKGWGLAERIERSWTQANSIRDLKDSEKLPI